MSVCYYLQYFDSHNRNKCTRTVSSNICRNSNGCFAANTKILMADGTEKNIQDVRAGDYVRNPVNGKAIRVENYTVGEQTREMYEITYAGKTVKATYNHPFLTDDGMKRAEDLVIGDSFYDKDLGLVEVEKMVEIPVEKGRLVWNLLLEGENKSNLIDYQDHIFVANGISSGDFYIQDTNEFAIKHEDQRFNEFLEKRGL